LKLLDGFKRYLEMKIENNWLQQQINPMHAKWLISNGKAEFSTAKISDFCFLDMKDKEKSEIFATFVV